MTSYDIPEGSALNAHCFCALNDYIRQELAHQRTPLPEIVAMRDRLQMSIRNAVVDSSVRHRKQSRESMSRSRLRAKGFDLPYRKPGPVPLVASRRRSA